MIKSPKQSLYRASRIKSTSSTSRASAIATRLNMMVARTALDLAKKLYRDSGGFRDSFLGHIAEKTRPDGDVSQSTQHCRRRYIPDSHPHHTVARRARRNRIYSF
jgi:hypothetical protein